jgi:hypothetical protein
MSGTLAEIIEKVETLTSEEREILLKKLEADNARDEVDRAYGKYAFVETSADAFCERKREEVELEERHWT